MIDCISQLLSSTKVLVLEDPRGPIYKSLSSSSSSDPKSLFLSLSSRSQSWTTITLLYIRRRKTSERNAHEWLLCCQSAKSACQIWTTAVWYLSMQDSRSVEPIIACFGHSSCCLPSTSRFYSEFIFQQGRAPAHRARQFSQINISQGSVATIRDKKTATEVSLANIAMKREVIMRIVHPHEHF